MAPLIREKKCMQPFAQILNHFYKVLRRWAKNSSALHEYISYPVPKDII